MTVQGDAASRCPPLAGRFRANLSHGDGTTKRRALLLERLFCALAPGARRPSRSCDQRDAGSSRPDPNLVEGCPASDSILSVRIGLASLLQASSFEGELLVLRPPLSSSKALFAAKPLLWRPIPSFFSTG